MKTSKLPKCKIVRVKILDECDTGILANREVKLGQKIDGVEICYAYPSPCVVCNDTRIELAEDVCRIVKTYEFEDTIAFLVESSGKVEIYVLELEVWKKIEKSFKEFESGKTTGLLLYGPPGTGKSSLAKIAQGLYGLPIVEISPEKVLGPHVGESEKQLSKLFDEMEKSSPCIGFIDECDPFFETGGREEGGVMLGDGATRVHQNLRNIFLRRLQKLHAHKPPILIIATTNRPLKYLDEAIRRAGRFENHVLVPPPSWKQIYAYLILYAEHVNRENIIRLCKVHGVPPDRLDYLAKLIASFGLGMADIKHLIETGEHVMDRVAAKQSKGFKRIVSLCPERVGITSLSKNFLKLVTLIRQYYTFKLTIAPRLAVRKIISSYQLDQRVWLLPILVHLFTEEGIPVVYVTDLDTVFIREAQLTAFECKGVLILNMASLEMMTVYPSLAQQIVESTCPVLIINSPPVTPGVAEDYTSEIMGGIKQLLIEGLKKSKIAELIVKVIADNLRVKLTEEQASKLANILKVPNPTADDSVIIECFRRLYDELMQVMIEQSPEVRTTQAQKALSKIEVWMGLTGKA